MSSPPVDAPSQLKSRFRLRKTGFIALAVVSIALALVLVFNGFGRRNDFVSVEPGAELNTVNVVFRFDRVTAQPFPATKFQDGYWKILLYGTVRNPNIDNTEVFSTNLAVLYPKSDDSENLLDPQTAESTYEVFLPSRIASLGGTDENPSTQRRMVPHSDEQLPVIFEFKFPETYVPERTLLVRAVEMEYTDPVLWGLGGGEPVWNIDSFGKRFTTTLPLTELPATD